MRTVLSLAVLPLLIPLQSITAQQAPPIETGGRIRVTAPTLGVDKLVGTSVEADATRIRVQADDQASPMTISLADMTRLEVSQGRKSNALKGLLIGSIVGVSTGAILGLAASLAESYDNPCADNEVECVAVGAAAFGVTGALVGLGIGALLKSERWEEVPLDRLRVNIVPHRDGRFALGLSVAF